MSVKPTYAELEQRVLELEARLGEFERADAALQRRDSRHREAEQLALLGHWELDLVAERLYWSEEIYRIFNLDPQQFGATYDAFLAAIHPADRAFVDRAYKESLRNRTGYDIVHRLLLRDGSVMYVREKCKTEYGPDGAPMRSLGTVQDITEQMRAKHGFAGIISRDPRMHELFELIRDLADVNAPVLIQGESGTGKELVAAAIHGAGCRADRPLVPVNCSALPEGLLESELFGHVRGAFTGAVRDKKGRFELADGGTLFLDEVADLPPVVQVKLLRVLQEGTFERVGGERTLSVDVRLVSAANRDLLREVEQGRFREDLYYRLKVVPVTLPPLRERKGDIPLLVDHFLEQAAHDGQNSLGLSDGAIAALMDHDWPGNIRELQSALRFALIKARGGAIEPQHLPPELRQPFSARPAAPDPRAGSTLPAAPGNGGARRPRRRKLTRPDVQRALAEAGGNKVQAARLLGVGRATLYRYLEDDPL